MQRTRSQAPGVRNPNDGAFHGGDVMTRPRSQVGKLMAFVGIIAINLAAARAYISGSEHFGWGLNCLLAVVPSAVALQVASLQLLRSRGRSLIFWAGFVSCGV